MTLAAVGAGIINLSIAARALIPSLSGEPEIEEIEISAALAISESQQAAAKRVDLSEDGLLTSPMLSHPEFQAEVRRWVRFWGTVPKARFSSYHSRMTGFAPMVDSVLAAERVPWSLRYLPIIESGYDPTAVSRASAVGMWQFMAPTAGDFGVEVTGLVDDRRDPIESTAAAALFPSQLHGEFHSWFLALAAYNAGPGRVRVPQETQEYVPNLFGAIIVAADPESFGYDTPEPVPFEFDRVPVLGRFHFETVALATGASRDEIARLNPEYVQGVTPHQQQVDLRVPAGRAEAFRAYFAQKAQAQGDGSP
jgi:hypothetical protein